MHTRSRFPLFSELILERTYLRLVLTLDRIPFVKLCLEEFHCSHRVSIRNLSIWLYSSEFSDFLKRFIYEFAQLLGAIF